MILFQQWSKDDINVKVFPLGASNMNNNFRELLPDSCTVITVMNRVLLSAICYFQRMLSESENCFNCRETVCDILRL